MTLLNEDPCSRGNTSRFTCPGGEGFPTAKTGGRILFPCAGWISAMECGGVRDGFANGAEAPLSPRGGHCLVWAVGKPSPPGPRPRGFHQQF